jgi:hypothetical protein
MMQSVTVYAAATNASGSPDLAMVSVRNHAEAIAAGVHYQQAREQLRAMGYEDPFVVFDDEGCHAFPWFPKGVKRYLGVK